MAPAQLTAVREQLRNGEVPSRVTVRDLLHWFGAQRRGWRVVRSIRQELGLLGLATDPDFESAYIDGSIAFVRAEGETAGATLGEAGMVREPTAEYVGGASHDPVFRLGRLAAANRAPLSVSPDGSLGEAVTLMMLHDYSQIPVMQGERSVKGAVSWESIAARLFNGSKLGAVRDFTDPCQVLSADSSIFEAIRLIADSEFVLVRDKDNRISGIVTNADLSAQFHQLGEPFLLLGEIENHLRRLIDGRFSPAELREARDPADAFRHIESVADLTFGEFVRLLQNPAMWARTDLSLDRSTFVERLDRIREIRNDVMHFDPDGISEEDLEKLRDFVAFLQKVRRLSA